MNYETKKIKVVTVKPDDGESLYDFWEALGQIEGGGWTVTGSLTITQRPDQA